MEVYINDNDPLIELFVGLALGVGAGIAGEAVKRATGISTAGTDTPTNIA